jgi:hypothetical protein
VAKVSGPLHGLRAAAAAGAGARLLPGLLRGDPGRGPRDERPGEAVKRQPIHICSGCGADVFRGTRFTDEGGTVWYVCGPCSRRLLHFLGKCHSHEWIAAALDRAQKQRR